ncbi:MAG: glycerophosphodiester phosphodiesterase [Clostridia bacterium]|nr:glycerophosphodiester phosphodiesterase [Clostridia bacterium]
MKMKKICSAALALLLVMIFAVPAFADSVYRSYKIPAGTMRMIAHRGYSAVAPENTLPAYRAAGESDFWGAECDIQLTSDGVWVLMHDDTVDRTTNGTGNVSDLTYAEIAALTVDGGNGLEQYPGTKVPTLTEYLDVCKEYRLHPVIEIKPSADPASLDGLAAILSAREEKNMFVIISFGGEICARMKELMPETPVYYLFSGSVSEQAIAFAAENGLDGLDVYCGMPDDAVQAIKAAGLDTIVWTVDDLETAERFYKLGVTAVTTNALTASAPEGNVFQRFFWKLRDLFYKLRLLMVAGS